MRSIGFVLAVALGLTGMPSVSAAPVADPLTERRSTGSTPGSLAG